LNIEDSLNKEIIAQSSVNEGTPYEEVDG